jgi:protein TonB
MNDQLETQDTVETLERVQTTPQGDRFGRSAGGSNGAVSNDRSRTEQQYQPVRARTAFDDNDADDPDDTFFGRHQAKLGIAVVLVVGGLTAYLVSHRSESAPRKAPERMVMVQPLPPPPPPPPPPPKVEPPKEEKMIEQAPPEDPDPKPADEPPPMIATGIKGDGPGGIAGLGSGRDRLGNGNTLGGARGGKWDGFARQVQNKVSEGLRRSPKTRAARVSSLTVRIWPDSTGRINRAKLAASTGDAALDAAIEDVLTGLQLPEPPPAGMPLPIVMRITERRPN